MSTRGANNNRTAVTVILLILILILAYDRLHQGQTVAPEGPTATPVVISNAEYAGEEDEDWIVTPAPEATSLPTPAPATQLADSRIADMPFALHILEVGKADSLLLRVGKEAMLIDGGNLEDGPYVESYLRANGVTKLKYVVATHPHEDHIGGLARIISDFQIGEVWLSPREHTTKTYLRMLDAIEQTDVPARVPDVGTSVKLGGATVEVLAPLTEYEEINDCSIVLRVTYKDRRYLLTGDVEKNAEEDLLLKYGDKLRADVLKVPHHGSKTSSTKAFLEAIAPQIAVMTCDELDPNATPPFDKIISRIEALAALYRTDRNGVVVIVSEGKTLEVITAR